MNTPRSLAVALGALLASATACKTDQPAPATAPAAKTSEAPAARTAETPRSARPALGDPPAGDSAGEWHKRRGARLDKDGDGVVSDAERAQAMHDRAVAMHQRLDSDGDGKLSPSELASARGRMHFDDPAALDTNKDGDISADELEAGIRARRAHRAAERTGGPGELP